MIELVGNNAVLVGPAGPLAVPEGDEITRKLAMLYEGQCEGLGPTAAAQKFGYSKQWYFQLLSGPRCFRRCDRSETAAVWFDDQHAQRRTGDRGLRASKKTSQVSPRP